EGNMVTLVKLIKAEVTENPHEHSISYLYYFLYDKLVKTNRIKSVKYIKNHFDTNITVSHLAEMENYNPTYFGDWFKKKTGYTPAGYLRCVRIDKAKELLQYSNYLLVEIAVQIGYGSNAAFTRAFKESEGMTPLDYRNKFLNKK
ncbi:MAG: AraC family transcriptional regulator, partial [Oscillospiraceae bacterium]